jgi:hypothetical protein
VWAIEITTRGSLSRSDPQRIDNYTTSSAGAIARCEQTKLEFNIMTAPDPKKARRAETPAGGGSLLTVLSAI